MYSPLQAGGLGNFRHPFFVWGEGLEWKIPFLNVYPLNHRVLATDAFFPCPLIKPYCFFQGCDFSM